MRFSYPEFSDVFKLLYTFSDLSYRQYPSPVFKKQKNEGFYVCKYIPNVQLYLEEKIFNGYKGVVLEIKDSQDEKVMKSKFMKADFRTHDNKNGFFDIDNFSIKSLGDLHPSFYGDLVLGFHYCPFNNSTKQKEYSLTITPINDNKEIRIGAFGACDLSKKDFKAYKLNKALKQEYKKLWKEDFKKASKYLKV